MDPLSQIVLHFLVALQVGATLPSLRSFRVSDPFPVLQFFSRLEGSFPFSSLYLTTSLHFPSLYLSVGFSGK